MSEESRDETWWTGPHRPKEPIDGDEAAPRADELELWSQEELVSPVPRPTLSYEQLEQNTQRLLEALRSELCDGLIRQLDRSPLLSSRLAPPQLRAWDATVHWNEVLSIPKGAPVTMRPANLKYLMEQQLKNPAIDWETYIKTLERQQGGFARLRRSLFGGSDPSWELTKARFAQRLVTTPLSHVIVDLRHPTQLARDGRGRPGRMTTRAFQLPLLDLASELDTVLSPSHQLRLSQDQAAGLGTSRIRDRLMELDWLLPELEVHAVSQSVFGENLATALAKTGTSAGPLACQPRPIVFDALYRAIQRRGVEILDPWNTPSQQSL